MRLARLLLLFVSGVCGVAGACGTPSAAPSAAPAASAPPPPETAPAKADPASYPTVTALPDGGQPATVRVSLARTPTERERGLMYVQNLPPDDGMLFIFEQEAEQSFWMKNTLIPLDLIFIRDDLSVAGVVAEAKPLTLEPRAVPAPSRYVLEVNGGWAARHGVVAGTKVRFDKIPL